MLVKDIRQFSFCCMQGRDINLTIVQEATGQFSIRLESPLNVLKSYDNITKDCVDKDKVFWFTLSTRIFNDVHLTLYQLEQVIRQEVDRYYESAS